MNQGELPALAITGATGAVGGRVARRLASAGVAQRLVVRDPDRCPELPGAVPVQASGYADRDGMRRALEGATTLFLVSGREALDRLDQHINAVDAAIEAGVGRIVYLSFLGAAPDSTFILARQHHGTEEHIRSTGVDFTFLRSSMYADFVPFFAGREGVIQGPAGEGKVSWVTRDDIAEAVAAVLTSDGHDGATYENTGPEALTLEETAEVLSRVAGRPVSYRNETMEEAWQSRRPTGAPDWEIEGWISSYLAIAAGEIARVSGDVRKLTGHEAQALEPFLLDNPDLWGHLIQ